MAFNGSGTFGLVEDFPADRDAGAPDHFIDADKVDAEFQNIKAGLEACLARSGENAMVGILQMGGYAIKLDADGDTLLRAPTDDQVDLMPAGTLVQRWTATGTAVTGTLSATGNISTSGGTIGGLSSAILGELANIGATAVSSLQWGYLGATAAFGATMMAVDTQVNGRVALGTVIGTNVQAWNTKLDAIAALTATDGNIIVGNGTTWVAESGATARTSLGVGLTDAPNFAGMTLTDNFTHSDAGNDFRFAAGTSDAADTSRLALAGGGGITTTRGSHALFHGNEHASQPGNLILRGGAVANAHVGITAYDSGNINIDANGTGGLNLKTAGSSRLYLDNSGNVGVGTVAMNYVFEVAGTFGFAPGSSVTPVANGDVVIEATANTTLTFKLKGSDGTVRSATLTLS